MLDATSIDLSPDALASQMLAGPHRFALFVDFDGTLADIAATPEQVQVAPDLPDHIIALQDLLGGAMAIVTGRRLAEVERYLAPARLPGAGLHGLEFSFAPVDTAEGERSPPEPLFAGLPHDALSEVVRATRPMAGVRLEYKGPILSVHYRQAPAYEQELGILLTRLLLEHKLDFHVKRGRAVLEIIPNGTSKGTALREIMSRAPFSGRLPIMIGDDRADEEAFAVAEEAGGVALKVGGEHFQSGDEPFENARAVRAWLASLVRAAGQDRPAAARGGAA